MMTAEERIARLETQASTLAEYNRDLRNLIDQIRAVLGTPNYVHVTEHARRIVADYQALREDYDLAFKLVEMAQEDKLRWRSVPLQAIGAAIDAWMLAGDMDDAMYDIREWYGSVIDAESRGNYATDIMAARAELQRVPRGEISDLYDAYAHATYEWPEGKQESFAAVGKWLGVI